MIAAAGGLILDVLKEFGVDENSFAIWTADHRDTLASYGGQFDKGSHVSEEVSRAEKVQRYGSIID